MIDTVIDTTVVQRGMIEHPAHRTPPRVNPRATPCVTLTALLLSMALSVGCARPPPPDVSDACTILEERKEWYYASLRAYEKWDIPIALTLAFIHQESSFKARAKTKRTKLLGFIPWKRVTTAYGYPQAINATWKQYKKETGKKFVRRSSFADSVDFIGWYNRKSVNVLGLAPQDAYNLYLAYHEGWSGYRKESYQEKSWLIEVAKRVQRNTNNYGLQLKRCAGRLKVPWYRLWTAGKPIDDNGEAVELVVSIL